MKFINIIIGAVALISTASSATVNARCGKGYGSCPTGTCCSKFGYCGTTADHCGAGCNINYGACLQTKKQNKNTTTIKKANKKTTTTPKKNVKKTTTTPKNVKKTTTTPKKNVKKTTTTPKNVKKTTTTPKKNVKKTTTTPKNVKKTTTTPKNVKKTTTTPKNVKKTTTTPKNVKKTTTTPKSAEPTGLCGGKYGSCPDGQCCSQYGYCGVTSEYCGTGCQTAFGVCNSTKKDNKKDNKKEKISTNGRCGAEFGSCPKGQCCSQYGYCGTESDHCGTGCQSNFGQCGVVTGFKYYSSCVNKKHWALTFDDGPYEYDMDLLDLLKKKGVKATFFINGANVMDIKTKKAKNIIQRMDKDGHIVASHTWSHADISKISKKNLISEMTNLEDYIYKYIGKKPAFMRPPYGSGDGDIEIAKTLKSLGYTAACLWNVDTLDWDKTGNVDYALSVFKKYLGKPILSLNHNYYSDISKKSLLTLVEKEIDFMKKQGYTPVTMDKCLGLNAYQK